MIEREKERKKESLDMKTDTENDLHDKDLEDLKEGLELEHHQLVVVSCSWLLGLLPYRRGNYRIKFLRHVFKLVGEFLC